MRIYNFNKERGINAIFQRHGTNAYIIHSSFYGFVGVADVEENEKKEIDVILYLKEDSRSWYWSLKDICIRNIRKLENQYLPHKVNFKVVYKNIDISINLNVDIKLN